MSGLLRKCVLPALAIMLVAAGCARQTGLVPPEIHYGSETCADCGMIIAEPHYAAALAWRPAAGAPVQTADFDDIGCLLNWRRHHAGAQIVAEWVKNIRTADWLDAATAHYLKDEKFTTPMGSGIVAGGAENDFEVPPASAHALTWSELIEPKEAPVTARQNAPAN